MLSLYSIELSSIPFLFLKPLLFFLIHYHMCYGIHGIAWKVLLVMVPFMVFKTLHVYTIFNWTFIDTFLVFETSFNESNPLIHVLWYRWHCMEGMNYYCLYD